MTLAREETCCVLDLGSACGMSSAAELKALLIEGLASAPELQVDLQGVEEIHVTVLQLLWAAGREAHRRKQAFIVRVPEAVVRLGQQAGFKDFPGVPGVPGPDAITGQASEPLQAVAQEG